MPIKRVFLPLIAALLLSPTVIHAQKSCAEDSDCKQGRLCHGAACVKVEKDKSLLRVRLNPASHLENLDSGNLAYCGSRRPMVE